ncbi:Msl8646 protein [Halorhodospira halochloris]|uniref:Msl8646 protein n=1 Tax=Halorhodospira halochloris TaxID=1052 RepID=A0A110B5N2_HALHR|nr:hypothetical protein [Halorhodospira halochloris]MBK1652987.1 hypothetical protein [Halorhodospira halochloris]BAU58088.1 Msl8646 protein [Halorhodospira halochloris]
MTRPSEHEQLSAEKAQLESFLADVPQESAIERIALEDRLESVRVRLEELATNSSEAARVSLTFSGKPVLNSEGILADFSAAALQKFEQMVATVGAYLRTGELRSSGPLPARQEHRLMITGTTVGSFGFHLEERSEPEQPEMGLEDSSVRKALDRVTRVIEGALESEEALAEEVSDLDSRSVRSLHEFMNTVASRDAWFRLEAVGRRVEFPDMEHLSRTVEWLQEDNIHEEEAELRGTLEGYLPHTRTFELAEDELGLVKGKIAPAIDDPHDLQPYLKKRVTLSVRKTALGGGKPRFALVSPPSSPDEDADV